MVGSCMVDRGSGVFDEEMYLAPAVGDLLVISNGIIGVCLGKPYGALYLSHCGHRPMVQRPAGGIFNFRSELSRSSSLLPTFHGQCDPSSPFAFASNSAQLQR